MLDTDRIQPSRGQPRKSFGAESLDELAQSMREQGLLQPVVVRPIEGGFELVAGERRWRAAQRAGLLKIPAIVRDVADERMLELALVENLQRENLNPMEEARAYRTLIEDLGLTQQLVAERVGRQRASVANMLRLLTLSGEVQERVQKGELSFGHARALAALTSPSSQSELAGRIVREGLSVRQVESLVARSNKTGAPRDGTRQVRGRDPNIVAAEDELQRAMGTKVRIHQTPGGGGRIEVHFFTGEELDRCYQLLLATARKAAGAPT